MHKEDGQRKQIRDLVIRTQIANPISALSLQVQNIGSASEPINLLIREKGIPSSAELYLSEPRNVILLEDVSKQGWEAALISDSPESSHAIGFDIQQQDIHTKPLMFVSEYNKANGDSTWIADNGQNTYFGCVGFELDDRNGFLAGINQNNINGKFKNLPQGFPFVVEISHSMSEVLLHFPNSKGIWETVTFSIKDEEARDLISQVRVVASLDQTILQELLNIIHLPLREDNIAIRSNVPDPLEGIIEGGTRHERYVRFFKDVLSEIWPESPESGEYGDDLHRSIRFDRGDGDISGFTQFGPHNRDLTNLTPKEFEIAVDNLGPDYLRVRSVPPHILNPDITVIPTGGSCVIETAGMRTIADLKRGIKKGFFTNQDLTKFVRGISEVAPTITHISGGVLGGQDALVHLIESDMWSDSLIKYGLTRNEAIKLVNSAYDRINEALARRSKLINPNSKILLVNFDELGLNKPIQDWINSIGDVYNPENRIQEVIYTYVGPQQLHLLKQALKAHMQAGLFTPEEETIAERLLNVTYQLRIKQIDHGRFKSMNLPKEVITGVRDLTEAERVKMFGDENNPPDEIYRLGTLLMKDVYDMQRNGTATALFAGFADLPTSGNQIQHESRDAGTPFKGQPGDNNFLNSVEVQLSNPAKLHRNNIGLHLAYLRTYLQDDQVRRTALIQEKNVLLPRVNPHIKHEAELNKRHENCTSKIEKYSAELLLQEKVLQLIDYLRHPEDSPSPDLIDTANKLKRQKIEALNRLKSKKNDLSKEDREDLNQIPILIFALEIIELGNIPHVDLSQISNELQDTEITAQKSMSNLRELINNKNTEKVDIEGQNEEVQRGLEDLRPDLDRIQEITEALNQISAQSLFPLSDNPFIHHAINFLWDPDFIYFMSEAVRIQKSQREEYANLNNGDAKLFKKEIRERNNNAMRALLTKIFPKLEAYLLYFYGKIDDERAFEFRQTRILNN